MKFSSFNLKQDLVKALNSLGYINTTEVQEVVIPKALKGENIIVKSETGSGKTHSFLIPILNGLEFDNKIQAIIISPTRELAKQTYNFIEDFKKFYPELNAKIFVSGIDTTRNEKSISSGCQIIVSTPGRLKALLSNNHFDFTSLKTIVLDEADMLVDQGFIEDIDAIIGRTNNPQIMVFSAFFPAKVQYFLKKYISADYTIDMSQTNYTAKNVKHFFINGKHREIDDLVLEFIKIKNPYLLMIFCNDREEARHLYEFLSSNKLKVGFLSGELTVRERNSMLRRINNDEFPIIVCTDIASRGLDILDVTDVLSIKLPNNLEYYYHRAGRTGRNNKDGNSYVLYNSDQLSGLRRLVDEGLEVSFLKIVNGELITNKSPLEVKKKKKTPEQTELDVEIRKAVNRNKSKKVKPGYKKKVRVAVEKVKKQQRRKAIKKNIRKQLEEKYRNEARSK